MTVLRALPGCGQPEQPALAHQASGSRRWARGCRSGVGPGPVTPGSEDVAYTWHGIELLEMKVDSLVPPDARRGSRCLPNGHRGWKALGVGGDGLRRAEMDGGEAHWVSSGPAETDHARFVLAGGQGQRPRTAACRLLCSHDGGQRLRRECTRSPEGTGGRRLEPLRGRHRLTRPPGPSWDAPGGLAHGWHSGSSTRSCWLGARTDW